MRIANKGVLPQRFVFGASAVFLLILVALPLTGVQATDSPAMPTMAMPTMAVPAPPPLANQPGAGIPGMPGMSATMPGGAQPSGIQTSGATSGAMPSMQAAAPAVPGMPAMGTLTMQQNAAPGVSAPPPLQQTNNGAAPEIGKTTSILEDKASDTAKGVVKSLDTTSDRMTLEDLNTARQTVARLEAMIDVEKHLAELEKVRADRGASASSRSSSLSTSSALSTVIPASALAPLPTPIAAPPPFFTPSLPKMAEKEKEKDKEKDKEKPKSTLSGVEISRITGANGKYSAVLKLANGDTKPVRVGDALDEHATVRWISSSTVLIEEFGETHTLRIKNVDAIFSALR
jgi:type IV pilus biogenesis protein PilP